MNALPTDAARVEGTPTGESGIGANWTADLNGKTPQSVLSVRCVRPLGPARAHDYSRRLIGRDEIVALLFNISDIVVGVNAIVPCRKEATMKKKKLTETERAEIAAWRERALANAQRTRELAERAQAKLDAERSSN